MVATLIWKSLENVFFFFYKKSVTDFRLVSSDLLHTTANIEEIYPISLTSVSSWITMDPVIGIPNHFKHRKVSVWWDLQDCPLPDGCFSTMVKNNIESALGDLGYDDSISSVSAYKNWENETGWSECLEMNDVNCVPVHAGKLYIFHLNCRFQLSLFDFELLF